MQNKSLILFELSCAINGIGFQPHYNLALHILCVYMFTHHEFVISHSVGQLLSSRDKIRCCSRCTTTATLFSHSFTRVAYDSPSLTIIQMRFVFFFDSEKKCGEEVRRSQKYGLAVNVEKK